MLFLKIIHVIHAIFMPTFRFSIYNDINKLIFYHKNFLTFYPKKWILSKKVDIL